MDGVPGTHDDLLAAAGLDASIIGEHQARLAAHPIYALGDRDALRRFMTHHVYPVWDFMSLIKALQGILAPARWPWRPEGDPAVRRFINELVLEEESDAAPPGWEPGWASHFELYCHAMTEIGADPAPARSFADHAASTGLERALAEHPVPEPAARFISTTFSLIDPDRPHRTAAALAVGREHTIPTMFRRFLAMMELGPDQAPAFHYYLDRHVHLDEDFHAPLSLKMLAHLCGDSEQRRHEAGEAAIEALRAREDFWDAVHARIGNATTEFDSAPRREQRVTG